MPSDTAGVYRTPAAAPTATPPAKEAFKMSSISNFLPKRELMINVARQLPVREYRVLATMTVCSYLLFAYTPKLNEGQ